jgi:hypothetical protein
MVRVAVTAAAPTIAGGVVTEHAGASTAPMGLLAKAQLRATLPVKPPLGLMVMVDVALGPGDAMVMSVPLNVKPGGTGAATETMAEVDSGGTPPAASAAVMVIEY